MYASLPDLLRLVAVPVLGWAAYTDVQTRRVSDRLWPPLFVLGVVLLGWEWLSLPAYRQDLFLVRVGVSLFVAGLAYLFWLTGGFGGADFKALAVLAVLFPTFPTYYVGEWALPIVVSTLGVFSLSVLTNAMLASLAYPLVLGVRNALDGEFALRMFVGRHVPVAETVETHGSLLEGSEGFTRSGLDLDALRMYLRWRGVSLAEVRADPDHYRDPASLPDEPNEPTDGAVHLRPDGGTDPAETDRPAADDPWGAAAFLADIEGDAYGTTPRQLRAGLDLLCERERVWISPGIPFVVPIFGGLVVGLVFGDLLFALLRALAVA
ncbi:A24 family peptidase [Halospeciosus flavus]|uniref:Prepilin peptidase n=1 Tax=Halospeciosus flavus TaxID=3032283 RepID=A0ABD5Z6Z4_9EURY|nr:A24 family peptidase [Halospeciosus flavus]